MTNTAPVAVLVRPSRELGGSNGRKFLQFMSLLACIFLLESANLRTYVAVNTAVFSIMSIPEDTLGAITKVSTLRLNVA